MKTQIVKIIIYKAKDWYFWRMKRSGRIIAESGKGYKRSKTCLKSLTNLVTAIEAMNYEYQLPLKK